MAGIVGRVASAAAGAIFSKDKQGDPVKGALIGAATMFVASRLLPVRIAGIGATLAAGYIAKKLAERELAKGDAAPAPAAPTRAPRRRKAAAAANAPDTASDRSADRTVPPTSRSTKVPQGQRSNETA